MSVFDKKVANRHEANARKALSKLGLVAVPGINRATVKIQNQIYAFSQPDVVQLPGADTYIIFGEPKVDDLMAKLQQAQSQQAFNPQDFQMPTSFDAPAQEEEESAGPEDETGLDQEEIEQVISQTGASRNKAVKALKSAGTVVDAILELSQQ
eukprot:UN00152